MVMELATLHKHFPVLHEAPGVAVLEPQVQGGPVIRKFNLEGRARVCGSPIDKRVEEV